MDTGIILAFTGMPGVGKSTAITYIKNNTDVIVHSTERFEKNYLKHLNIRVKKVRKRIIHCFPG